MSETYETLIKVVMRLNCRGWHSTSCAIHPTYKLFTGYGAHGDEKPELVPGKACDCGAEELVDETNKLLDQLRPGQEEFNFGRV